MKDFLHERKLGASVESRKHVRSWDVMWMGDGVRSFVEKWGRRGGVLAMNK